jgi:hypothetical protein
MSGFDVRNDNTRSYHLLNMTASKNLVMTFLILFAIALYGQEPDHTAMQPDHAMDAANATPLHVTSKVAIATEASRPVYRPVRCDHAGNVYFRAYQVDDKRVPILRADRQGKITRYSLDSDPDLVKGTAYDFSVVASNLDVYQPVQVGNDVYVVAFDDRGQIRWKRRLEKQFRVAHLISFDGGGYLAIGTEAKGPDAKGARTYEPVAAMFGQNGQFLFDISLERETTQWTPNKPETTQPTADEKDAAPPAGKHKVSPPLLALLNSDGQSDGNGNIYLMVPSEPPVVYFIRGLGGRVSWVEVTPPGEHMAAVAMTLWKNQVAIRFRHSFQGMSHGDDVISVFHSKRGDPAHGAAETARFSVPPELASSALACMLDDGKGASFVGPDATSMAIQHASAGSR